MSASRHTLAIEGATYQGSVALIRDGAVLCERTLHAEDGGAPRAGRGERLMPAIAECLAEVGIEGDHAAIERIVCGAGPGSFTSLRVAGSVAKGLAVGYGVELHAVSSLALSVVGAKPPLPSGEYLSLLDAMRGEFFAARISFNGSRAVRVGPTSLMSKDDLEDVRVREPTVRIVGSGQEIEAHPHARGVAPILDAIVAAGPVDLASWEPDYGRLAEAQVRWEAAHGRPLAT
jgi:tRNA threonylcarbamoyladenosine biosynthesis protein TsaB